MIIILAYLRGALRSWTIWANGVLLAAVVAAPQLQEQLPLIKPYVSNNGFQHLTLIVLLLNVALRVKTKTALSTK